MNMFTKTAAVGVITAAASTAGWGGFATPPAAEAGARVATVEVADNDGASASAVRRYRNKATGQCLESRVTRGHTYTKRCANTARQRWIPLVVKGNRVMLKNASTGRCLAGNFYEPSRVHVQTLKCDRASERQHWQTLYFGKDRVFVNVAMTKALGKRYVLDANAAGHVYMHAANSGGYQRWRP